MLNSLVGKREACQQIPPCVEISKILWHKQSAFPQTTLSPDCTFFPEGKAGLDLFNEMTSGGNMRPTNSRVDAAAVRNAGFDSYPETLTLLAWSLLWAVLAVLLCVPTRAQGQDAPGVKRRAAPDTQLNRTAVSANYGKLPLGFEANQGQSDPQVKFLSRGNGYSLFLTDSAAVLALTTGDSHSSKSLDRLGKEPAPAKHAKTDVLRMELAGASPG